MKISGILLNVDGVMYLRQYSKDGEFRDIEIVHDDLSIQINDNSAQINQRSDGEYFIDYTDKVLGK